MSPFRHTSLSLCVLLIAATNALVPHQSHELTQAAQRALSSPKPMPSPRTESDRYTPPATPVDPASAIQHIESHIDFAEFLAEDPDSICIIKFHAAWCKSCQKFGRLYDQHMRQSQPGVRYASVEWSKNTALCKGLGIKRLPTVQMYHGAELLTSFACAPSKFQLFKDRLRYMADLSDAGLAKQKKKPIQDPSLEKKLESMQVNLEESALRETLAKGEALIKEHVEKEQAESSKQQEVNSSPVPILDAATQGAAFSGVVSSHEAPKRRWWGGSRNGGETTQ